jgi:hypothetical protein
MKSRSVLENVPSQVQEREERERERENQSLSTHLERNEINGGSKV